MYWIATVSEMKSIYKQTRSIRTMNIGALEMSNKRDGARFIKGMTVTIETDIGGLYKREGTVAYVNPSGDVALYVEGCINVQVFAPHLLTLHTKEQ